MANAVSQEIFLYAIAMSIAREEGDDVVRDIFEFYALTPGILPYRTTGEYKPLYKDGAIIGSYPTWQANFQGGYYLDGVPLDKPFILAPNIDSLSKNYAQYYPTALPIQAPDLPSSGPTVFDAPNLPNNVLQYPLTDGRLTFGALPTTDDRAGGMTSAQPGIDPQTFKEISFEFEGHRYKANYDASLNGLNTVLYDIDSRSALYVGGGDRTQGLIEKFINDGILNDSSYSYVLNTPSSKTAVTRIGGDGFVQSVTYKDVKDNSFDLDGDRRPDIVWHHASGEADVWFMSGQDVTGGGAFANSTYGFDIVAHGDVDADGRTDLILRNSHTGEINVWFMNGQSIAGGGYVANPGTDWTVAGVTDSDADGRGDLVLRNRLTGEIDIWRLDESGKIAQGSGYVGLPGPDWFVVGTGDFNRDGHGDLVLRNDLTGEINLWKLNGTAVLRSSGYVANPGADWTVATTGDFNGDGTSDLILRNSKTGEINAWLMEDRAIIGGSGYVANPGPSWQVDQAGDFNLDGTADLLIHNTSTNEVDVWYMEGAKLVGGGYIAILPAEWHLV